GRTGGPDREQPLDQLSGTAVAAAAVRRCRGYRGAAALAARPSGCVSADNAAAREFALEPEDNARLASLCGPLDANLRLIESRLGVKIRRRGQSFRIHGEHASATEAVLKDLFAQAGHRELSPEQVHLCLIEHANGQGSDDGVTVTLAPPPHGAR